jgi:hypothetical protein
MISVEESRSLLVERPIFSQSVGPGFLIKPEVLNIADIGKRRE